MSERLFFIGPGRAGLALGYAFWQADALADAIYCGRHAEPPAHPLFTQGIAEYARGIVPPGRRTSAVFLSVPDDSLPECATALARHGPAPPGCPAYHLSGALGADVLAPLHEQGYAVGTLHPLQSLAHAVTGADRLPGSTFAISGEPGAVASARRLLQHLDARYVTIPVSQRPLYHAAAVLTSNHLATLLAVAERMLGRAGVSEPDAIRALLPLARGTLDNIDELGIENALTGPVSRGDVETVRLHLRSMEPREREVYRALGEELTALAASWGVLEDEAATKMRELFTRDG